MPNASRSLHPLTHRIHHTKSVFVLLFLLMAENDGEIQGIQATSLTNKSDLNIDVVFNEAYKLYYLYG